MEAYLVLTGSTGTEPEPPNRTASKPNRADPWPEFTHHKPEPFANRNRLRTGTVTNWNRSRAGTVYEPEPFTS